MKTIVHFYSKKHYFIILFIFLTLSSFSPPRKHLINTNYIDINPTLVCNSPTLSISRTGTSVIYSWLNNGTTPSTVSLQYSTDGGATWTGNSGSPTSPRTWTIPDLTPIQYRILSYATGCPTLTSNIVGCDIPTWNSATRSITNPTDVTLSWNNNSSGPSGSVAFEYSNDSGVTWTQTCVGGFTSPRICSIPNSPAGINTLIRIRLLGCGTLSVSTNISLANYYLSTGTQAVGNFYSAGNPKSIGCGSICVTLSTTSFSCYLDTNANLVTAGTQIYINNTSTSLPVPATSANCALYGAAAAPSNSCNRMDTGICWIRFVSATNPLQYTIWNVNPTTGIVSGNSLSCP